jgi:DNA primase
VVKELQPLFAAVRQPVLRSEYLRLVADRLSLSEEVIQKQWLHGNRDAVKPSRTPQRRSFEPRFPQTQTLEERIVRLMVHHPDLIPDVAASGAVAYFEEVGLKTVAEAILQSPHPPGNPFQAAAVYDGLTDVGLQELFTRLLLEESGMEEPRVQLRDWLEMVARRKRKQEGQDLNEALRQADQEGDLSRTLDILSKKIQNLKSPRKGEGSI